MNTSMVTLKISPHIKKSLQTAAKKRNVSQSAIVKEAINMWLKEKKEDISLSEWFVKQKTVYKLKNPPKDIVENMDKYLYEDFR